MDTGVLRTIWTVIEETPTHYLQRVSSNEQIKFLLQQVENKRVLSTPQKAEARQYISDHRTMIREMSLEQVMKEIALGLNDVRTDRKQMSGSK